MKRVIIILFSAIVGLEVGVTISAYLIYAAAVAAYPLFADDSSLAWVWLLYYTLVPLVGLVAMVKAVKFSRRWY